MNKKGAEGAIWVLVVFIILVAVAFIVIPGFSSYWSKAFGAIKSVGDKYIAGLGNIPGNIGQVTEGQKETSSAEKNMNLLFQEGNSFSKDIENFDIKQCSQDFINKLSTAYKKYEEYVKNCNDPKSKYYGGCKQTGAENYKVESEKKIAAIKVIKDRCTPIINTQKDLSKDLPEDVKKLKEDAITYEKLGNYKKAIEILEEYIKKLKEIGEDKNKDLINEAYVKISEDYKNIIRNNIRSNTKETYLDAWSIFNKLGNENLKDSIKDEYKKVILELAEPIDCGKISYDACPIFGNRIEFTVLGTKISLDTLKEDKTYSRKIGCFRFAQPGGVSQCISCRVYSSCGDYDKNLFNSAYWIENCNNDPCGFGPCKVEPIWYQLWNNDCVKL
ncbi:MAG: hypothetical protein V1815_01640 [Candidatus Woesearchaeota archaeon]